MTDPATRRPRYWLNFAWVFAGVGIVSIGGGIWIASAGSPIGWINVALGVIFGLQSILYVHQYRRARSAEGDETRPHNGPDPGSGG